MARKNDQYQNPAFPSTEFPEEYMRQFNPDFFLPIHRNPDAPPELYRFESDVNRCRVYAPPLDFVIELDALLNADPDENLSEFIIQTSDDESEKENVKIANGKMDSVRVDEKNDVSRTQGKILSEDEASEISIKHVKAERSNQKYLKVASADFNNGNSTEFPQSLLKKHKEKRHQGKKSSGTSISSDSSPAQRSRDRSTRRRKRTDCSLRKRSTDSYSSSSGSSSSDTVVYKKSIHDHKKDKKHEPITYGPYLEKAELVKYETEGCISNQKAKRVEADSSWFGAIEHKKNKVEGYRRRKSSSSSISRNSTLRRRSRDRISRRRKRTDSSLRKRSTDSYSSSRANSSSDTVVCEKSIHKHKKDKRDEPITYGPYFEKSELMKYETEGCISNQKAKTVEEGSSCNGAIEHKKHKEKKCQRKSCCTSISKDSSPRRRSRDRSPRKRNTDSYSSSRGNSSSDTVVFEKSIHEHEKHKKQELITYGPYLEKSELTNHETEGCSSNQKAKKVEVDSNCDGVVEHKKHKEKKYRRRKSSSTSISRDSSPRQRSRDRSPRKRNTYSYSSSRGNSSSDTVLYEKSIHEHKKDKKCELRTCDSYLEKSELVKCETEEITEPEYLFGYYPCEVCQITLNTEISYKAHMKGKKHLKALKKKIGEIPDSVLKAVRKTEESQNYPKRIRRRVKGERAFIQDIIEDEIEIACPGLDQITEIRGFTQTTYCCNICDVSCSSNDLLPHLRGFKHQRNCLQYFSPAVHKRKSIQEKLKRIEELHGRGMVVVEEEW